MHGPEMIDAEVVLTEFPGELGTILWKTVRSIRLWSEIQGAEGGVFEEGAYGRRVERLEGTAMPAELRQSLTRAAGVLQPRVRAATVAAACRELAEWAVERGTLGTAIELMQAGAVAVPDDPQIAREVARISRIRADYPRAETWYRQTVARARRARDWPEFSRGYIGLGSVSVLRGNYPQARKCLTRGLRAAKRFALRPLIGAAYHELAVLAIQSERPAELTRYARAAIHAYGAGHPRLPALAFDCGVFLLSRGHFEEALRTFQTVPEEYGTPADRLLRAAALSRAAAGAGNLALYQRAWSAAESLLDEPSVAVGMATALLSLARAAESAGDLDRAGAAVHRLTSAAELHGETELQFEAAQLLESMAEAPRAAPARPKPPTPSRGLLHLVESFEESLLGVGSV